MEDVKRTCIYKRPRAISKHPEQLATNTSVLYRQCPTNCFQIAAACNRGSVKALLASSYVQLIHANNFNELSAHETCLSIACKFGTCDVKRYVIEDPKVEHADTNPNSILLTTCKQELFTAVVVSNWLFKDPPRLFKRVNNGFLLPVYVAAQMKDSTALKTLLKALVSIEYTNKANESDNKKTSLHYAAESGRRDNVNLLLEYNQVDINARDADGNTPCHLASAKEHTDVFELFKQHKRWHKLAFNNNKKTADEVNPLNGDLFDAIKSGDIERIKLNIEQRESSSLRLDTIVNRHGNTPLHVALNCDIPPWAEVVKLLVKTNIFLLKAKNTVGNCPLSIAALIADSNTFEMMINKADRDTILTTDASRNNILHLASQSKLDTLKKVQQICNTALTIGANCNTFDKTPMHYAAQNASDSPGVLREIIKIVYKGSELDRIKINEKDATEGKTALHYAATEEKLTLNCKELLKQDNVDVNIQDKNGDTPCHIASSEGNQEIVKLIKANHSYDSTKKNNKEKTAAEVNPLNYMALRHFLVERSLDDVKRHIDSGAEFITFENDNNALHIVAEKDTNVQRRHAKIRYLVEHYSEMVNKPNDTRSYPVHLALRAADAESFRLIAEVNPAHLNKPFGNKNTRILHEAVQRTFIDTINVILAFPNVDTNVEDDNGMTAAHYAIESQQIAVFDLLVRHLSTDVNTQYQRNQSAAHLAVIHERLELLEYILSRPDLNMIEDDHGKIAVQYALESQQIEIFNTLVRYPRTNINTRYQQGQTAAHLAILHEDLDLLEHIISQPDLNVNARDDKGDTPAHCAARLDNTDFLKTLSEHEQFDESIENFQREDVKNAVSVLNEMTMLSSVYSGDITVHSRNSCTVTIEGERSVDLKLTFPNTFPGSDPPNYELQAPWLRGEFRTKMDQTLNEIYQRHKPVNIPSLWIEKIRDMLRELRGDFRDDVVGATSKAQEIVVPAIYQGEPVTNKGGTFQGFLAKVKNKEEYDMVMDAMQRNKKAGKATYRINAYRYELTGDGKKNASILGDYDDDGENMAGHRLLKLLEENNVVNVVVVVTRWHSGTHIGPVRFKFITDCAKILLREYGYIN